MTSRKKKVKYPIALTLEDIEESDDRSFFHEICIKAGQNACNENKALGLPITYLDNGWVVREMPDGSIEKISQVFTEEELKKGRRLQAGKVLYVNKK